MKDILLLYTIMSYPLIIGYLVTLAANEESMMTRRMSNTAYIIFVVLAPLSLLVILGGLLCKFSKE